MVIVYLIPEALFRRMNICKKGRHEIQLNICISKMFNINILKVFLQLLIECHLNFVKKYSNLILVEIPIFIL